MPIVHIVLFEWKPTTSHATVQDVDAHSHYAFTKKILTRLRLATAWLPSPKNASTLPPKNPTSNPSAAAAITAQRAIK